MIRVYTTYSCGADQKQERTMAHVGVPTVRSPGPQFLIQQLAAQIAQAEAQAEFASGKSSSDREWQTFA